MLTQAEEGMKLFAAQNGAAAEVDKAAAEAYKADIENRNFDRICFAMMEKLNLLVVCIRLFTAKSRMHENAEELRLYNYTYPTKLGTVRVLL